MALPSMQQVFDREACGGQGYSHTARDGSLCPGSGNAAVNTASGRKPRKSKVARGKGAVLTAASKSNFPFRTQKPVASERERPVTLPTKKATGVYPGPRVA